MSNNFGNYLQWIQHFLFCTTVPSPMEQVVPNTPRTVGSRQPSEICPSSSLRKDTEQCNSTVTPSSGDGLSIHQTTKLPSINKVPGPLAAVPDATGDHAPSASKESTDTKCTAYGLQETPRRSRRDRVARFRRSPEARCNTTNDVPDFLDSI